MATAVGGPGRTAARVARALRSGRRRPARHLLRQWDPTHHREGPQMVGFKNGTALDVVINLQYVNRIDKYGRFYRVTHHVVPLVLLT